MTDFATCIVRERAKSSVVATKDWTPYHKGDKTRRFRRVPVVGEIVSLVDGDPPTGIERIQGKQDERRVRYMRVAFVVHDFVGAGTATYGANPIVIVTPL